MVKKKRKERVEEGFTHLHENFKKNLARILEQRNIPVIELAARVGCSHSHISDSLRGRHVPTLSWIECLAEALGIPPVEFLLETKYIPKDRSRAVKKSAK